MEGTDRVRFCSKCQRPVYDFEQMQLPEAESLIFQKEGRRNVVLYKRADGKFLTRNCLVGVWKKLSRMLTISCGVLALLGLVIFFALTPPPARKTLTSVPTASRNKTVKPGQPSGNARVSVTVIMPANHQNVVPGMNSHTLPNLVQSQGSQNPAIGNNTTPPNRATSATGKYLPPGNNPTQSNQVPGTPAPSLPPANNPTQPNQAAGAPAPNLLPGNNPTQPNQAPGTPAPNLLPGNNPTQPDKATDNTDWEQPPKSR